VSGEYPGITRADVRLFADEAASQEVGQADTTAIEDDGTILSFVGSVQERGVRVVEVRLGLAMNGGRADGRLGLSEIEVIARGDAPPDQRITAAVPMIPMEQRDDPFDARVYDDQEGTSAPSAADDSEVAVVFDGCPDGSVVAFDFSDENPLPMPGDEGVRVRFAGLDQDDDGSLRLPRESNERSIYQVILEGPCERCMWTGIGLDSEGATQSKVLVAARAGSKPKLTGPFTSPMSHEANLLQPPLLGRFLELSFTLTAADRAHSPVLHGFRACHKVL